MKTFNNLILLVVWGLVGLVSSCRLTDHVLPDDTNRRVAFTASDGKLYFVNANSGQRIWANPFATPTDVFLEPIFRGKYAYLPVAGGNLLAIDTASKSVAWQTSFMWLTTPVASTGGLFYVGDRTSRPSASYFGAVDSTGKATWSFNSQGSQPAVGPGILNGVAYFGNSTGTVYALDALTGGKKWELQTGTGFKANLVVGLQTLFVLPDDGKLYAFDVNTQNQRWTFPVVPAGYEAMTLDAVNETLYVVGADKKVHALNARTGAKKWEFGTPDGFARSPAVAENAVYIGGQDGKLYALDAQTGQKKWDFATGGPVSTTPTVANGVVFFGSNDKKLYALDAATGAKKWESPVDGVINTTPVVWTSKGQHTGFRERGGQATN